ncbi:MAG: FixH family protein [Chloroflexota bacterium]
MPSARYILLAILVAALAAAPRALANGGTIQLSSQPAGPYLVTVFTSPSPVRVGIVDVSVLIQRPDSNEAVLDAHVVVSVQPVDHVGPADTFSATHEQATNKLYHATNVDLPTEGRWRIEVQAFGPEGDGAVGFELDVSRESLLDRPLQLAMLMAIPLVVVAWWLTRGKRPQGNGDA